METSDKSVFKLYKKKSQSDHYGKDPLCRLHLPPVKKKIFGRRFYCPVCVGMKKKTSSGKSFR